MATTGQWKVGDNIPGSFLWYTIANLPISVFSVPPTASYTRPDGATGVVALTQRGATPYWDFSYTPGVVGLHVVEAVCLDPLAAAARPPVLAILVSTHSLADLALTTDLPAPLTDVQTQAAAAAALAAYPVAKPEDLQPAAEAALAAYGTAKTSDIPALEAIQTAVTNAVTALGYDLTRAEKLDHLDENVSAIVTGDVSVTLDPVSMAAAATAALTAYPAAKPSDIPDATALQAAAAAALLAFNTAKASDVPDATAIQVAANAALLALGYTLDRAEKIDHLDQNVSSIVVGDVNVAVDPAAIQTAAEAALAAYTAAKVSDLPPAPLDAEGTIAALQSALDAQGYTGERAVLLDTLTNLMVNTAEAVWEYAGRTLTDIDFSTVWDRMLDDVEAVNIPGSAAWYLSQLITIRDKTLLITAENVSFVAPVDPLTGNMRIVRGDSYTRSSARSLPQWYNDDWLAFDLPHAQSITFKAKTRYVDTIFEKPASLLSDTEVLLELTAAETGVFAIGLDAYRYDLEAVLATGDVVTLAQGVLAVIRDVR